MQVLVHVPAEEDEEAMREAVRARLREQERERLAQIERAERLANELVHQMAAADADVPTRHPDQINARLRRGQLRRRSRTHDLLSMDGYDPDGEYGRGKRKTSKHKKKKNNKSRSSKKK